MSIGTLPDALVIGTTVGKLGTLHTNMASFSANDVAVVENWRKFLWVPSWVPFFFKGPRDPRGPRPPKLPSKDRIKCPERTTFCIPLQNRGQRRSSPGRPRAPFLSSLFSVSTRHKPKHRWHENPTIGGRHRKATRRQTPRKSPKKTPWRPKAQAYRFDPLKKTKNKKIWVRGHYR